MPAPDSNRLRFEQWVRSYAPLLYRYAFRVTGNAHIAEDLVQETFMEAWRCVARQGADERAKGWLYQIMRRRCSHFFRSSRARRRMVSLPDDAHAGPADSSRPPLDTLADQDALQSALSALSEPMRQTFLSVFVLGCTCRQTADLQNVPIGTVLSRLHSARLALRAALTRVRSPGGNGTIGNTGGAKRS